MTPMSMTVMASEEHEVSQVLSWGVGVGSLLILLLLLGALIAFGGGREHS
jgi:hypothetical protein